MSECVVRMEMPSKDKVCGMAFDFCGIWFCPVKNQYCHQPDNGNIPSWCPIICQLPEGHGRLVDADALKEKAVHYSETEYHFDHDAVEMDDINDAPTIVLAERREK